MNLNHFTAKSCLPVAVANLFKTCSPGSGGYGEAKVLERLPWDMSTDFCQWDEVLGLVALGFHQVMSTFGIEGVITGGMESGWYCTWIISRL